MSEDLITKNSDDTISFKEVRKAIEKIEKIKQTGFSSKGYIPPLDMLYEMLSEENFKENFPYLIFIYETTDMKSSKEYKLLEREISSYVNEYKKYIENTRKEKDDENEENL